MEHVLHSGLLDERDTERNPGMSDNAKLIVRTIIWSEHRARKKGLIDMATHD